MMTSSCLVNRVKIFGENHFAKNAQFWNDFLQSTGACETKLTESLGYKTGNDATSKLFMSYGEKMYRNKIADGTIQYFLN